MQKKIDEKTIKEVAQRMIEKHKNITIRELQKIAMSHDEDPNWYIFSSEDYWSYIYDCATKKSK